MLISGIQPFTILDYPDKAACIIFTPGCNFRCGYCHNPEFVLPENIIKMKDSFIPEEAVFHFLVTRQKLLDGVVITGGEPTIAADLIPFMQKIRRLGFSVKLDTNGNRPDVLKKALSERVVDYVAMDIKTDLGSYRKLVGPLVDPNNIAESVKLLKNSHIQYEFRSTLLKEVHSDTILDEMAKLIEGSEKWYLQRFRPGTTLSSEYTNFHSFNDVELTNIAERYREKINSIIIR